MKDEEEDVQCLIPNVHHFWFRSFLFFLAMYNIEHVIVQ